MKRKHYTRDEVAEITANPEASEAVERFLKKQGNGVISYDMGPYGEYIRAKAKASFIFTLIVTFVMTYYVLIPLIYLSTDFVTTDISLVTTFQCEFQDILREF